MPVYHLNPIDLLFFRDARPMEPQSPGGGHGACWPHPAVFFDALHAAFWRAFPGPAEKGNNGFAAHSFYRKSDGQRRVVKPGGTFFQTLTTAGPFPVLNGQWHFPLPADSQPNGGRLLPITKNAGQSNLPQPFPLYPLGSTEAPSKAQPAPWWSREAIQAYLAGNTNPATIATVADDELFGAEWTTGIGTEPATGTQDGKRIYSAQYLRLQEKARLGLWASLPQSGSDGMDKLFPPGEANPVLVAGGQQRICRVDKQESTDLTQLLPVSAPLSAGATRVKWLLLSPAIFPEVASQGHPGGWLPTWIHPTDGGVMLQKVTTGAAADSQFRSQRRRAAANPALRQCKLVAACIPKPVAINGWTEALHVPAGDSRKETGPRATQLAVPAGAVYFFDCPNHEAALELRTLLSWHGDQESNLERVLHRRSSLLGEKGFGLGVCGEWSPFPG